LVGASAGSGGNSGSGSLVGADALAEQQRYGGLVGAGVSSGNNSTGSLASIGALRTAAAPEASSVAASPPVRIPAAAG
jgi:hypothetical protein